VRIANAASASAVPTASVLIANAKPAANALTQRTLAAQTQRTIAAQAKRNAPLNATAVTANVAQAADALTARSSLDIGLFKDLLNL